VISEVFCRILTHFDWYSINFLPNSLFKFFQDIRPMLKNIFLLVAPQKKSQMYKSGERAGHLISPLRETRCVGNNCRSLVIETRSDSTLGQL
jgi:hypothetical protein